MPNAFDDVIPARERAIGPDATVLRTLPSPRRRMVGPFIFSDQLGPLCYEPGAGMDVRPHPHVGLATVTLSFRGTIVHRDSTGVEQVIRPGEVNWMTAGRGVVHSERSPLPDRDGDEVELLQTWVALPDDHEDDEASFDHVGTSDLPTTTIGGATVTVMVGDYDGTWSPVRGRSRLVLATVDLEPGASHTLAEGHAERAVLAHTGQVHVDGLGLDTTAMGVLDGAGEPTVTNVGDDEARVVVLGGDPVGRRHIAWNFVASTRERLREAARRWDDHEFPEVPGDRDEREELPPSLRP